MTNPASNAPNGSPETDIPPQTQPAGIVVERHFCDFESFEYHADENTYRAIYSHDAESPSTAVISAVAAATDTDPLNIEPLYSTIDPDALDTLAMPQHSTERDLHVSFEFHDCEVTVSSFGNLKIHPLESHETASAVGD